VSGQREKTSPRVWLPAPTAEQAAAVAAYFETHEVSAAAIPDLTILAH